MNTKEIRENTVDDILKIISEESFELFRLVVAIQVSKSEKDNSLLKKKKRYIARLKTVLRQKQLGI